MRKDILSSLFLMVLSIGCAYSSIHYLSGKLELIFVFLSGILFGIFLMLLKLNVKNDRLNLYKRELEKESVLSDENTAKVKVLESKINVLEKALENALKNK